MFNRKKAHSSKQRNHDVERTAVALIHNVLTNQCRDNRALLHRDDDPFFAADVAHELAHDFAFISVRLQGKKAAIADARRVIDTLATREPN